MDDIIEVLKDNLIIPLLKKYKLIIYSPKIDNYSTALNGMIEYKIKCSCEESDDTVSFLGLTLFFGKDFHGTENVSGIYNYQAFITYLGGEEQGGREVNAGILNLDNEENCINSINSIYNGLKELGFTPLLNDTSNIQYGKVLVTLNQSWFVAKLKVKIYNGDNLIGTVEKGQIWTSSFDEDTILTFKINFYTKHDIKVKKNVNNRIVLNYYNNEFTYDVNYVIEDINLEEEAKKIENKKFLEWSQGQYRKVKLRRLFYIGLIVFSVLKYEGRISSIIFSCSLMALFINSLRFHTKWKHISGPKYLHMDQVYDFQIQVKLIPNLNDRLKDYGLKVRINPVSDDPSFHCYSGIFKNGNKIYLSFYNRHDEMTNQKEYKYPLLVKYSYEHSNEKTIGEIDLSNGSNVQEAIKLIIKTLEDDDVIYKDILGGEMK